MAHLDFTLLAIWAVAIGSFSMLVFLFATWPSKTRDKKVSAKSFITSFESLSASDWSGPNPRKSSTGKQNLPNWEAPDESALDGILLPPSGLESASRAAARRKKSGPPSLKQRIVRAGIYRKHGIHTFHVARLLLTIAMLCSGLLIVAFTSLPWVFLAYVGPIAGLAGYLAPSFWLDRQLRVRQTKMRRALPDALDLVTVCLQGGLSLPAALARVAREFGPAHKMLANELSIVEREIQMGRNTGEAMLQFAYRFDLEELRSLSSVIGQTEKYGGSVAGALKNYAEGLRIKRRQRAEEMAQKAAVKLLFPTLFCIFPGIFVVVLGPTAMRMYEVMVGVSWSG